MHLCTFLPQICPYTSEIPSGRSCNLRNFSKSPAAGVHKIDINFSAIFPQFSAIFPQFFRIFLETISIDISYARLKIDITFSLCRYKIETKIVFGGTKNSWFPNSGGFWAQIVQKQAKSCKLVHFCLKNVHIPLKFPPVGGATFEIFLSPLHPKCTKLISIFRNFSAIFRNFSAIFRNFSEGLRYQFSPPLH